MPVIIEECKTTFVERKREGANAANYRANYDIEIVLVMH